jgi:hypothetical protein
MATLHGISLTVGVLLGLGQIAGRGRRVHRACSGGHRPALAKIDSVG